MQGSLDPFDFMLAENLHMTVERMYSEMSNHEYMQWRAFYKYRNSMEELAVKTAQSKRR